MYHERERWRREEAYIRRTRIVFSGHFRERMRTRGITLQEIARVIETGEIIQGHAPWTYGNNPNPVRVVMGHGEGDRVLHVVVALRKDAVVLVTVYEPDPEIWEDDLKTLKLRGKKE
ncbi:MAG: DUF4258 domain-containing protein [Peptococcaceae bacterium]|nr:DUF4258 domain-containing protein [Peptococcaceae bacterium]